MKPRAFLLAAALLAGCGGNPAGPTAILATTWRLQSIERAGTDTVTVAAPDRYTLRLEANGQAVLRADCNSCSGGYTLDRNVLDLGRLACTLVACGAGSLEGPFVSVLSSRPLARADGDGLVLTSADGTLRFAR